GDASERIVFVPCRKAMAFACQSLIAGRQKRKPIRVNPVIRGQNSSFLILDSYSMDKQSICG
ncbi:MAG: hypothetical protein K9K79_09455, partial [Desulfohalobiaceae bacterium]|nr:hypothetical protein [Desulfohalobiaceae bacterium]